MKSQKERMLAGELYVAHDEELGRENLRAKRMTRLFNQTTEEQAQERQRLLKTMFKRFGDGGYIEPPFHTDYGTNTTIGQNFYANYDAIFVDCGPITIGDNAGSYTHLRAHETKAKLGCRLLPGKKKFTSL